MEGFVQHVREFLFPEGSWMAVYNYLCTHDMFRPPVKTTGAPPETVPQVLAVGAAWALCAWLAYILISRAGRRLVGDWLVRRGIWARKKEDVFSRYFEENDRRGELLFGMRLVGELILCGALFSWFFAEVCAANTPGMRWTYFSFANVLLVVSLVMLIECLGVRYLFEDCKRGYALDHTIIPSAELLLRPALQDDGQAGHCVSVLSDAMERYASRRCWKQLYYLIGDGGALEDTGRRALKAMLDDVCYAPAPTFRRMRPAQRHTFRLISDVIGYVPDAGIPEEDKSGGDEDPADTGN